jgi:hypothetical protein
MISRTLICSTAERKNKSSTIQNINCFKPKNPAVIQPGSFRCPSIISLHLTIASGSRNKFNEQYPQKRFPLAAHRSQLK